MNEESELQRDPRDLLPLKLLEPKVQEQDPWVDDVLDRKLVADRLTKLILNQSQPLVISIHGAWGTGKTFMLKRWRQELENQEFSAIYFNAWEDDFCDDPLLAILAQLADHFKEDRLNELARRAVNLAIPLIRENALGMLKAATGITLKVNQEEKGSTSLADAYLEQKKIRDKLKKELSNLSANVAMETSRPVVFIIDELDRCRPTFAIELLERVKHIFDVPNMVFVLGINRDELCKSLASVYGDIDTDVYLRRFFDFEFNLPEVGRRRFAQHLINKYQLNKVAGSIIEPRQLGIYERVFPKFWSALSLSLRDIDYGIRLISVLVRTVRPNTYIYPYLLTVLIAVKFKKPEFYHSLASGDFETSAIMDYLESEYRRDLVDEELISDLDKIEGYLYCADTANTPDQQRGENAETEILRLQQADVEFGFDIISHRARNAEPQQLPRILEGIWHGREIGLNGQVLAKLTTLIDTHQQELRR